MPFIHVIGAMDIKVTHVKALNLLGFRTKREYLAMHNNGNCFKST
jgi:hypothetical protein